MAPVMKSKSASREDDIEQTVNESREIVIKKSVDLHKTVMKRMWMVNAAKKLKSFIAHQQSLKKSERCSVQEIQSLLKTLPKSF